MTKNKLNEVRGIILILASSAIGEKMLTHFAIRKRSRKVETVRRLTQVCGGVGSRAEVVAVLRQLESMGFGKVIGLRGDNPRFRWAEV